MTFFGLARPDGCYACNVASCICLGTPTPTPEFENGARVFRVNDQGGFMLVIEGRPGSSGAQVGVNVPDPIPGQPFRPDLQLLADRPLGNGSAAVCDTNSQTGGGVPGFGPSDFGPSQAVTDALVDLACRFTPFFPTSPCTLNANGNEAVLTPGGLPSGSRQFCNIVSPLIGFPSGDTKLTVQLRDRSGNLGPRQSIIVRRSP